jgi:hypothetical protein
VFRRFRYSETIARLRAVSSTRRLSVGFISCQFSVILSVCLPTRVILRSQSGHCKPSEVSLSQPGDDARCCSATVAVYGCNLRRSLPRARPRLSHSLFQWSKEGLRWDTTSQQDLQGSAARVISLMSSSTQCIKCMTTFHGR